MKTWLWSVFSSLILAKLFWKGNEIESNFFPFRRIGRNHKTLQDWERKACFSILSLLTDWEGRTPKNSSKFWWHLYITICPLCQIRWQTKLTRVHYIVQNNWSKLRYMWAFFPNTHLSQCSYWFPPNLLYNWCTLNELDWKSDRKIQTCLK